MSAGWFPCQCCGVDCTLFTDDFNRADSTTVGNGWTESAGSWEIKDNTLIGSGTSSILNRTVPSISPASKGSIYEYDIKQMGVGTRHGTSTYVFFQDKDCVMIKGIPFQSEQFRCTNVLSTGDNIKFYHGTTVAVYVNDNIIARHTGLHTQHNMNISGTNVVGIDDFKIVEPLQIGATGQSGECPEVPTCIWPKSTYDKSMSSYPLAPDTIRATFTVSSGISCCTGLSGISYILDTTQAANLCLSYEYDDLPN